MSTPNEGSPATAPPAVPSHRIERELGSGGMAVVYLARHETFGEWRAIKYLKPDVGVRAGAKQRFLAEAQIMRQLRHPSVAQVLEAG